MKKGSRYRVSPVMVEIMIDMVLQRGGRKIMVSRSGRPWRMKSRRTRKGKLTEKCILARYIIKRMPILQTKQIEKAGNADEGIGDLIQLLLVDVIHNTLGSQSAYKNGNAADQDKRKMLRR